MKKKCLLYLEIAALLLTVPVYAQFIDLDECENKEIIEYLAENNIIDGVTKQTFSPKSVVTRAEFSKIICRTMNYNNEEWENQFSDVPDDAWYTHYVNILAKKRIINGYAGKFRPQDSITNEEAAKILVTLYEKETIGLKYQGTYAAFMKDYFEISEWARDYVNKGVMIGAVRNLDKPADISNNDASKRSVTELFRPKDAMLREECAEVIFNVANAIKISNKYKED